ncbi:uncharacterized protein JN550_006945 [Neoarthrinium moseri]|uniref:uncharacterized protein n=1 Tax=Neoarthrinium moseri TaxID=1658444 RepID=UPI001FDB3C8F|nr:uncharacterized protein JN550_006945 [Neoarthrinium moseri]KAI1867804.1 hypothetical protein JN550_006945 [Neoarthrinium moseri]
MSRSLEPTLLSLLPTLPSASSLPPPLLEYASSLLSLSRHNASTLKAEEEVARLYACAHLACERLKTTLDLPPIQARPPVIPRIYKRLYTHLDHILPAASVGKSGRVRTPSGKAREATGVFGSAAGQRIRDRATPNKEMSLAQFRPKADGTPTKSTGKAVLPGTGRTAAARDALPPWIRPTTQFMCLKLDNQRMGRTVLAGMQTIVVPHGKRNRDAWVTEHLSPLLAAVCFMVAMKIANLETGAQISSDQYIALRRDIVRALKSARTEVDHRREDEEVFWEGWSNPTPKAVDEALAKIKESQWQEEDWFAGIDDLVASTHAAGDRDLEMAGADDHGSGSKAQIQRGDTMLQSRWVMTDEKREDYRRWKADILSHIEEMEKARGSAMEVDATA